MPGHPGRLSHYIRISLRSHMSDSIGMNRRDFIGRSAAAIAGSMTLPRKRIVLLADHWSQ